MSAVSDLVDNLFGTVVKDEYAVLKPICDSYLTAVQGNPAPENVLAKGILFQQEVLAALPDLGSNAARDTAVALKAFLDAQLPGLIASLPSTQQASAQAAGQQAAG